MSFLSPNNAEYLSARITKRGRNAIAQGDFVISYFQVGDSEFDYTDPFSGFTGILGAPSQKVLAPFDHESGVKYPYSLDVSGTTSFGVPVLNPNPNKIPIRNAMGPAGFVSSYTSTGATIECGIQVVNITGLTGTNELTVQTGSTYQVGDFITLAYKEFHNGIYTGYSNSLVFKILEISNNTLTLDRSVPIITGLTNNVEIISNKCNIEFPTAPTEGCIPQLPDNLEQHDPWTMNIVWSDKPIGYDVNELDQNLTGFTSNIYVSTKELLGYTSTSGQTFNDITGGTITNPTSYVNTVGDLVNVTPEEQRTIAIIHYSELGDLVDDPERFFKYDDYISYDTSTIDSIINDENGNPLSDAEYFEIYIPFIQYHRNTGTTAGALFYMDSTDYFINSTKNAYHSLQFRYLLDEQNNRVGKVFPGNKIVVFDDQELVAVLDYKSNRKFTLPAPQLSLINSNKPAEESLLSGTTGQTLWVTYMLANTTDPNNTTQFNSLPCNYFGKISASNLLIYNTNGTPTAIPYNVGVRFSSAEFQNISNIFTGVTSGFHADRFYILAQETDGSLPSHDAWIMMDFTPHICNCHHDNLIQQSDLVNKTFVIDLIEYEAGTIFNLVDYLGSVPVSGTTYGQEPEFGDEQPFPGSIKLVRGADTHEFNFLVNLPSTQFVTSNNPTYRTGERSVITEIALLDDNYEPLVVGKTSVPVQRTGTQVFAVKLDF